MTGSLSEKDYKEGLIASCLDLYESYGYNFIKRIEKPVADVHFSIAPGFNSDKEEISEEEKEKERKEEELQQKKEAEKNKKRREKINEVYKKGRESSSYKQLKPLDRIDPTTYEYRRKSLASRICRGQDFIDKIFKILREKVKQKQSENKLFPALKHSFLLLPTFSEMLVDFMQKKGLDSKDVYEAANIDRRLFSKILSDTYYQPSKETAIYLCLALHLNIEEANEFLASADYTLSRNRISNIVVEYFIRTGNYNIQDLLEVISDIHDLAKKESDN